MAGNKNSGGGPKVKIQEDVFKKKVDEYITATMQNEILRPSLPHFCTVFLSNGKERICSSDLLGWLKYVDNPESAYYSRANELKFFLDWIRGQVISGGKFDDPAGKKYGETVLNKDHGDGVTYAPKDAVPPVMQVDVKFGGNDPRAKKASK